MNAIIFKKKGSEPMKTIICDICGKPKTIEKGFKVKIKAYELIFPHIDICSDCMDEILDQIGEVVCPNCAHYPENGISTNAICIRCTHYQSFMRKERKNEN